MKPNWHLVTYVRPGSDNMALILAANGGVAARRAPRDATVLRVRRISKKERRRLEGLLADWEHTDKLLSALRRSGTYPPKTRPAHTFSTIIDPPPAPTAQRS